MTKSFNTYLVAYLVAAVVFCVLDFIWLTIVAKNFYQSQLGPLMLAEPKMIPAATFYLVYLLGLLVFAIMPAVREQSWLTAVLMSGLLGIVAYGTYDLSNLATLKGWSPTLTVIDIIWGACVSAAAGSAGYYATRFFNSN
ncbi:DUF2177 family protein [Undibacterium sp. RTI2.1]|uniref:DUF2177 family protein n=1 Tax=unclassified Undibacterium TaxID=2630295 RepID=UPI002AB41B03|nr:MULTISPECIES: DUF2177 family protein [unclassified Undibacterium]MDY7536683.1 DUF2177 family protein [Undibacterium sp. 5I1]MEB0032658.1 DUF2177 family protein [Undibacterium sp. RTI2.1]MEB0118559.1 DUF2177 family protein [Undibacterium sp. RTI2.2]MEB0230272.1 DUF2177 family protein [Undibacterium sp. 10I3]MEB0257972.1 DUF2177 family protein [Undibacterium sp. 5I1]